MKNGFLRRPRIFVGGLVVLLACVAAASAHAGPIEALPDREWISRKGSRLVARLAIMPDHPEAVVANQSILLVPADPKRPPLSLAYDQLSLDDIRYVQSLNRRDPQTSDWRDVQKATLRYTDGQPVPGSLGYVYTRSRELWFKTRDDEGFLLFLSSLAPESAARVLAAWPLPPVFETRLADFRPLDTGSALPPRHEIKNAPLEKQEGSYCVPASAVMIADHHGFRITQKQLAHLSSDASRRHHGTYAYDMVNAMEALGFYGETRLWADLDTKEDYARFQRDILPFIRASLHRDGPLYVSFKAGVYGGGGHGCVIVGYNDASGGELLIHNPWGKRERHDYRKFSRDAHAVVRFHLPPPATGDSAALEARVVAAFHRSPVDLTDALRLLKDAGLRPALRFHARHDRREDRNEVQRWALAQGPRIIRSTLQRHLAALIPVVRENRIAGWHLVRLEPGQPNPVVRSRGPAAWTELARPPVDSLLNSWSTPVQVLGDFGWDMPLIELDA